MMGAGVRSSSTGTQMGLCPRLWSSSPALVMYQGQEKWLIRQ